MDDLINEELITTVLNFLSNKISNPVIKEKLENEIVKPLTQLIIKGMYPYIITTIVIFALMFICIIGTFIILLSKKNKAI